MLANVVRRSEVKRQLHKPSTDGNLVLNRAINKGGVRVWTGFDLLRLCYNGRLL
jgi:hypothetical protein